MESARYSIAKLKAGLSSILADVARGEEIVVTDHNRPVAKIVSMRRLTPLPRVDLDALRSIKPIPLKKGARSSADLIRQLRDEDRH